MNLSVTRVSEMQQVGRCLEAVIMHSVIYTCKLMLIWMALHHLWSFVNRAPPLGINTVHSCHLLLEDSYGRIIEVCVVFLSRQRCRTHRMDSYASLVLVMNFSLVCRVYILNRLKLSWYLWQLVCVSVHQCPVHYMLRLLIAQWRPIGNRLQHMPAWVHSLVHKHNVKLLNLLQKRANSCRKEWPHQNNLIIGNPSTQLKII